METRVLGHAKYKSLQLIMEGKIEGNSRPGKRKTLWIKNMRGWFGLDSMSLFRPTAWKVRILVTIVNLRKKYMLMQTTTFILASQVKTAYRLLSTNLWRKSRWNKYLYNASDTKIHVDLYNVKRHKSKKHNTKQIVCDNCIYVMV